LVFFSSSSLSFFSLYGQDWQEIRLEAPAQRLGLTGLACGSRFEAQLAAFNRVGLGVPSTLLRFSTAGAGTAYTPNR